MLSSIENITTKEEGVSLEWAQLYETQRSLRKVLGSESQESGSRPTVADPKKHKIFQFSAAGTKQSYFGGKQRQRLEMSSCKGFFLSFLLFLFHLVVLFCFSRQGFSV